MLKKWPIRDRPLTLSASQILFVAIFQLEHETHGKESVVQWSHSAKEVQKKYTDFQPFIISKCEIMNFANCILLVRESRGCREGVTKAGAGIDWVNSVHTSAATSYTTNCCDNIVSCLSRH